MDSPTPAGFVADAEEALGKALAMYAQSVADMHLWSRRVVFLADYLDHISAWAAAGGTGPRPPKPQEPTPE